MSIIKHAVICAAGMGTRLGMNMPKCLVKVGDKTIIQHQLELLKEVKDIRIVVGFMEERVIDHVLEIRRDVTFIRNINYQSTTNAYSLFLGAQYLNEAYLMLDGDLLIEREQYKSFIQSIKQDKLLVGATPSKTEEAVFINLDSKLQQCISFDRNFDTGYEWSGIAYIPKSVNILSSGQFVYQELEKYLPCKVHVLECYEIDTPKDLSIAHAMFKNGL